MKIAVECSLDELTPDQRRLLLERRPEDEPELRDRVRRILDDVRNRGDDALLEMARRFDDVELDGVEVPRDRWEQALETLDARVRSSLETAARNIELFHRAQMPEAVELEVAPGVRLGRRTVPLARAGVYAPGGRAAYPSSVLMGVVPARTAGVEEVVVCSPPGPDGSPPDAVLAACAIAGAARLFAVGGAGAVGAMAYGTDAVPRVDVVVGPGNRWVTEAKRQVAGEVPIDGPAGPSEVLVVAEEDGATPERAAAELVAQAEHDPDAAVALVTASSSLLEATRRSLERQVRDTPRREVVEAALSRCGALLLASDLEAALGFAEAYAPEHLALYTRSPRRDLERVRTAGTVFLGQDSAVAFGDYLTGANHVLPTSGRARSFSGLSTDHFLRSYTWQELSAEGARSLADLVRTLAAAEGLPAHARAAELRGGEAEAEERGNEGPEGSGSGPAGAEGGPVTSFPRDDYRSLERYAPDRRPVPVDLSDNTNRWGPHPAALRVLRSASPESLTRYPSVYADDLRRTVAGGFGVPASAVTTGCGSDDLLDSAFRAVSAGGGRVAFLEPTFSMIPVFARMNGLDATAVPWDEAAGDPGRVLDVEPDLIYLCSPNNPTGAVLPDGWIDELLEMGGDDGPVVLLDEAYADFADRSHLTRAPSTRRLLVLRTLSKAYGLAGLRIGFGVGSEEVVGELDKSRGPYKVGRLDETAAIRALEDPAGWVDEIVEKTTANRARLRTELNRRGHDPLPSWANFLLLPLESVSAADVTAGLREEGVAVRPFSGLPRIGDAVRITVGPWRQLERFLDALDRILPPGAGEGDEGTKKEETT